MSKIKNIFHTGWSHGEYFDYWSFVHFLTGVILGIGAIIISFPRFPSLIFIIVMLTLYEGIEMLVKVSEGFKNILLDIIVGGLGSWVAIFFLPQIMSKQDILGVLSICIVISLMLVYGGWHNFLKRKATQSNSYKIILYALYFVYISGILIIILSFYYWLFYR